MQNRTVFYRLMKATTKENSPTKNLRDTAKLDLKKKITLFTRPLKKTKQSQETKTHFICTYVHRKQMQL